MRNEVIGSRDASDMRDAERDPAWKMEVSHDQIERYERHAVIGRMMLYAFRELVDAGTSLQRKEIELLFQRVKNRCIHDDERILIQDMEQRILKEFDTCLSRDELIPFLPIVQKHLFPWVPVTSLMDERSFWVAPFGTAVFFVPVEGRKDGLARDGSILSGEVGRSFKLNREPVPDILKRPVLIYTQNAEEKRLVCSHELMHSICARFIHPAPDRSYSAPDRFIFHHVREELVAYLFGGEWPPYLKSISGGDGDDEMVLRSISEEIRDGLLVVEGIKDAKTAAAEAEQFTSSLERVWREVVRLKWENEHAYDLMLSKVLFSESLTEIAFHLSQFPERDIDLLRQVFTNEQVFVPRRAFRALDRLERFRFSRVHGVEKVVELLDQSLSDAQSTFPENLKDAARQLIERYKRKPTP